MNSFDITLPRLRERGEAMLPCETEPPEIWFPKASKDVDVAKDLCNNRCWVRDACLKHAMEFEEGSGKSRYGVFGGLDEEERFKLSLTMGHKVDRTKKKGRLF